MNPDVYSSIIYNSYIVETAQVSINWWIKKKCAIYICYILFIRIYIYTMKYYSATKRNGILPFAKTWIELENIMLSKISQRKTDTI